MALTESEAQEVYAQLAASLRENGLEWVLTQVEEKIALGHIRTRKLRARDLPDLSAFEGLVPPVSISQARTKQATFVVSEEFSNKEKLEFLIESIGYAVSAPRDIGEQLLNGLSEIAPLNALIFAPEAAVKESIRVEASELRSRSSAGHQLEDLLRQLKAEVKP